MLIGGGHNVKDESIANVFGPAFSMLIKWTEGLKVQIDPAPLGEPNRFESAKYNNKNRLLKRDGQMEGTGCCIVETNTIGNRPQWMVR